MYFLILVYYLMNEVVYLVIFVILKKLVCLRELIKLIKKNKIKSRIIIFFILIIVILFMKLIKIFINFCFK